MRSKTALPGLPIGRGDVWYRPVPRALMLGLGALGLAPFAGLMAVAAGLVATSTFTLAILLPVFITTMALILWAANHEPHVMHRAVVGVAAGFLGVVGYDALVGLLQLVGPGSGPGIVWPGVYIAPGSLSIEAPALALHWLALGGFWGMTYAVIAGRAHWGWGMVYGFVLWGVGVSASMGLPHGADLVPALDTGRASLLLAGHLIFGTVLGALNAAVQPEPPLNAKIIFLRDYVTDRASVLRRSRRPSQAQAIPDGD